MCFIVEVEDVALGPSVRGLLHGNGSYRVRGIFDNDLRRLRTDVDVVPSGGVSPDVLRKEKAGTCMGDLHAFMEPSALFVQKQRDAFLSSRGGVLRIGCPLRHDKSLIVHKKCNDSSPSSWCSGPGFPTGR